MNSAQRRAVEALGFIYGNAGSQYTKGNHEFISRTLSGHPDPEHYQPTQECKDAFEKVMAGDYSTLPKSLADGLRKAEEREEHWK